MNQNGNANQVSEKIDTKSMARKSDAAEENSRPSCSNQCRILRLRILEVKH